MPTPTMIGGQAFAPARSTVSTTKSMTPGTPSAGTSIRSALMFSAPKPFDATREPDSVAGDDVDVHDANVAPAVQLVAAIFTRRVGSPVTDQRRYPACVPSRTPA